MKKILFLISLFFISSIVLGAVVPIGGTTAQNNAYTGVKNEISLDNQLWNLRLHDGRTPGGHLIYISTSNYSYYASYLNTPGLFYNGGNVGIGTPNPQGMLQIGDLNSGIGEATYRGQLILQQANITGSASLGGIEFKTFGSNGYGWKLTPTLDSNNNFIISTRNGTSQWTDILKLGLNGRTFVYSLGAGTGSDVNYTSGDEIVYVQSARKYKKNIRPYETILDRVMKLSVQRFQLKSDDTEDIGLIADDTLSVLPELVVTKDGEPESVRYSRLAVPLLKAFQEYKVQTDLKVQELQKEIDELKKKVK